MRRGGTHKQAQTLSLLPGAAPTIPASILDLLVLWLWGQDLGWGRAAQPCLDREGSPWLPSLGSSLCQ